MDQLCLDPCIWPARRKAQLNARQMLVNAKLQRTRLHMQKKRRRKEQLEFRSNQQVLISALTHFS